MKNDPSFGGDDDLRRMFEQHNAGVRDDLEGIRKLLTESERGLYVVLTNLPTLYTKTCGSDCPDGCDLLKYPRYMTAKRLLEEAERDVTAALALLGEKP